MGNWIKYMIIILPFIVATVLISYQTTRHHVNIASTQEVQAVALQSTNVGEIRTAGVNRLDKKTIATNLIVEIMKKHKVKGQDITIDYVFLDQNGNPTENENTIQSVQFKVSIVDKKGKVVSTSTQNIALDRYID